MVLLRGKDPRAPIETFRYSIVYLMALFAALLIDHYIPIGIPALQSGFELEVFNGMSGSAQ